MTTRRASRGGRRTKRAVLRDVASLMRRRGWIVLLFLVLIPTAAYLYSARQPKVYEATMIIEADGTEYSTMIGGNLISDPGTADAMVGYSATPLVAASTSRRLGRDYGAVLTHAARLDTHSGWVVMSTTARTPESAVRGANAYFRALTEYVRLEARRSLQLVTVAARRTLAQTHVAVQRRQAAHTLSQLNALAQARPQPLRIIQAPEPKATEPNPGRNAGLALALTLLLAPGLAVGLHRLDRNVRKASQLEGLSGVPLLAAVPSAAFADGERASRNEAPFEMLRDTLTFSSGERRPDTIAIVSALSGQGRTTVAIRLALSYAHTGRRVVLVDADLHQPVVAARLAVTDRPGLSEVLSGHDLSPALRSVDGFDGLLSVLPAGSPSPNPAEMLGTARMSSLLERLAQAYDVVLLDTAPMLPTSDTLALLHQVSGIVAVARLNRIPRHAVRRLSQIATAAGGRMLGIVATGAQAEHGEWPSPSRPGSAVVCPAAVAPHRAPGSSHRRRANSSL